MDGPQRPNQATHAQHSKSLQGLELVSICMVRAAGRAASDNIYQMACKLSLSQFGAQVRAPPLCPAFRTYALASSRCQTVFIGGYYTKSGR